MGWYGPKGSCGCCGDCSCPLVVCEQCNPPPFSEDPVKNFLYTTVKIEGFPDTITRDAPTNVTMEWTGLAAVNGTYQKAIYYDSNCDLQGFITTIPATLTLTNNTTSETFTAGFDWTLTIRGQTGLQGWDFSANMDISEYCSGSYPAWVKTALGCSFSPSIVCSSFSSNLFPENVRCEDERVVHTSHVCFSAAQGTQFSTRTTFETTFGQGGLRPIEYVIYNVSNIPETYNIRFLGTAAYEVVGLDAFNGMYQRDIDPQSCFGRQLEIDIDVQLRAVMLATAPPCLAPVPGVGTTVQAVLHLPPIGVLGKIITINPGATSGLPELTISLLEEIPEFPCDEVEYSLTEADECLLNPSPKLTLTVQAFAL